MKKITLHYAHLNLGGRDIETHTFDNSWELRDFMQNKIFNSGLKVFLMSFQVEAEHPEIVITENPMMLERFIEDFEGVVHIQEYRSFESAYAVAFDMRDHHPLCYDIDVSSLN